MAAITGTTVRYGPITIDDCLTAVEQRPIWQAFTYIWTEYTLTVEGTLAPNWVSYILQGGGGATTAVATPGQAAPVSLVALEFLMTQPRQQLVYSVNGVNVMVSPEPGSKTDANLGPIVREWQVLELFHDQSAKVRWRVTICLNEAQNYSDSAPFLLAHTWKMTHLVNEAYYTRRVVEGEAQFDAAKIPVGTNPDAYRQFLMLPCPNGWKRQNVRVTAEDTGNKLVYSYEDISQRLCLLSTAANIVDIEYTQDAGYNQVATLDREIQAAGTLGSMFMRPVEAIAGAAGAAATGNFAGAAAAGGGLVRGWGSDTLSFIHNFCPTRYTTIFLRVTGNELASMAYLSSVAHVILLSRLTTSTADANKFSKRLNERRDYKRGIVELTTTYTAGLVDRTEVAPGAAGPIMGSLNGLWSPDENVSVYANWSGGPAALPAPVPGASIPRNGNGSRGYYVGQCLARAIQESTQLPAPPTAPPNVPSNLTNPNSP